MVAVNHSGMTSFSLGDESVCFRCCIYLCYPEWFINLICSFAVCTFFLSTGMQNLNTALVLFLLFSWLAAKAACIFFVQVADNLRISSGSMSSIPQGDTELRNLKPIRSLDLDRKAIACHQNFPAKYLMVTLLICAADSWDNGMKSVDCTAHIKAAK
jgi:hypothetical protein